MNVLPIGQYRWGGRNLTTAPKLLKEQFLTTEWWALYRDILKVGELVPWSQFYKVFTSANLQLVTLSGRNETMVPCLYWPEGSSWHLNVRRKSHKLDKNLPGRGSNHLVCLWNSLKLNLIGRKAITSLRPPFGPPVPPRNVWQHFQNVAERKFIVSFWPDDVLPRWMNYTEYTHTVTNRLVTVLPVLFSFCKKNKQTTHSMWSKFQNWSYY